jgi:hypothetical protein
MELKRPAQIHQGHGAGLVGATHHSRLVQFYVIAELRVIAELHRIRLCRQGRRHLRVSSALLIGPVPLLKGLLPQGQVQIATA